MNSFRFVFCSFLFVTFLLYKPVYLQDSHTFISSLSEHKVLFDQSTTLINQSSVFIQNRENEVFIPVPIVLQKPELPNGCEVTSLSAVINYLGFPVSKTTLSDTFLPKQPFYRKEGKLFGANPYQYYAGNPRDKTGFFSYAPPIVETSKRYFSSIQENVNTLDISGSKPEDLKILLKQGIPVVIWVTLELDQPKIKYSWYFSDTNELFQAPVNLHCVVLNGYKDDEMFVMNPLKGQVTYNEKMFFDSYISLGSHAFILNNKNIKNRKLY